MGSKFNKNDIDMDGKMMKNNERKYYFYKVFLHERVYLNKGANNSIYMSTNGMSNFTVDEIQKAGYIPYFFKKQKE